MLNNEQTLSLNILKHGYNCCILGDAGTGKSYFINEFIKWCNDNDKSIIITAPTGIAALNIGGVTVHRAFGIPAKPLIENPKKIPSILKDADILIIDEIGTLRIDVFDFISKILISLNKFRRNNGQKDLQVILCGDFFQLPPVISKTDRSILEEVYGDNIKTGFAFQSKLWEVYNFKYILLTKQMRQSNSAFIKALNMIRLGDNRGLQYISNNCAKSRIENAIEICGINKEVEKKNKEEFNKLHTKIFKYKSKITGTVEESDMLVSPLLELRVGCRVLAVVNDRNDEYRNGSIGVVERLTKNKVFVKFDDGTVEINPYTWNIKEYTNNNSKTEEKIIGTYTQYPLKLAYAITIHKSQGQTYDKANLNPYCWDCGQLYVAISRVRNIENLYITNYLSSKYLVVSNEVKEFYNYVKSRNSLNAFINENT